MKTYDLIIIGGGPAGLAAAVAAKDNGIDNIMILERDKSLGGILQQCIHNGFGLHTFKEELTGPEYAARFIEKEGFQSSGLRRVGIRYFSVLIKLMTGKLVTDPTSGMRMVNRQVMEIYAQNYPKDYPEPESVMAILRMGKKVTELPVVMREREEGSSSIAGFKSAYYMIKVTLAILMERLRR